MKYPDINSANSYLFTLEWRKYFWVFDLFGSFIKLHENGQTIWFSESIRIKWRNNWDPYFNRHKTNKNNKPSLFGANPNKMVPKSRTLNFFIYFLTISCSKISKKWQQTLKTIIDRYDRPSSVRGLIKPTPHPVHAHYES